MGRFKQWLEFSCGGGTSSPMHGLPTFDKGNANMNVRSKTQTQDGRVGHDADRMETEPEKLFGLKKKSDRKRASRNIDTKSGSKDNRPNIVY